MQCSTDPSHWSQESGQDKITVCSELRDIYQSQARLGPGEFNARNFGESQWWVGLAGEIVGREEIYFK